MLDGATLRRQGGTLRIAACPQLDARYAPPPRDAWLRLERDSAECVDTLPFVDDSTMERIFRTKGAGKKGAGKACTRVLTWGFKRLCKKSLNMLAVCPPQIRNNRSVCW
eukprot:7376691-Prymnesium_polylepis.1